MPATVTDLKQWKAAHPPALMFFNHGLACALAWQKLWMSFVLPQSRPKFVISTDKHL